MSEMTERVEKALLAALLEHAGVHADQVDIGPVTRAAIGAMREPLVAVLRARRAIYQTTADARDPLAEDNLNRYDLAVHAIETMDYAEAAVEAAMDAAAIP